MQRLMQFGHDHPWLVLSLLTSLCFLSLLPIRGLRQDPSFQGMMIEGDPARQLYEDTIHRFGTDRICIIFIQDDELFTPEKLGLIENLAYDLESVPGVSKVESLFSVQDFKNDAGVLTAGPLMDRIPESKEAAENLRRRALGNPILVNTLISRDGSATAIKLFLQANSADPGYYLDFSDRVEALLDPLHGAFNRIYQHGNSRFRTTMSRMMVLDQRRMVPISVLVLLFALVITTGSLSGALLPLLTSGASVLITAGFMGLLGIPINILTIIVPSLIIVIGSTEDIHLLSEYNETIRSEHSKDLAIQFVISKMGLVVTLTAVTTFLGFASICVNKITILRQFGMASAFGLFVNPVVTALLTPIYLKFFGRVGPKRAMDRPEENRKGVFVWLEGLFNRMVKRRKKSVLIVSVGLCVLIGAFAMRVRLNNDIMGVFKEDSQIIKEANEISRELTGVQSFFIRISGGHKDIFKEPENLAQVAAIQSHIREQGVFDKSVSLADFLRLINREMHAGDPAANALPHSIEEVSQYLLFMHDSDCQQYASSDFSEVIIRVNHNLHSSSQQKKALEELEAFMKRTLNPHFKYAFTGEGILTLNAADAIAGGQAMSVTLLLFIIFLIMSVLFLNFKAGLLSLVPNVLPILIYFGVMGIFSIPLNIGTAMVAAIAIGISLDDTLHLMIRYNTEMRRLGSQDEAIESSLSAILRPAFSTSLALALGFAVLALSHFVSVVHFGVLSSLVMIVAYLCDMLVTPVLLSSTRLLTLWDMLSLHVKKEVIEKSEFFRDMRLWQIRKIVLLGRIIEIKAGEHVFREWDKGDTMFLVFEGEGLIYGMREETNKMISYAKVSEGDVFGEITMLDRWPRSASVKAVKDLKVVEINRDAFDRLQRLYPRIAGKAYKNLARILGHRLVITNWRLYENESE
ncbi:MAG: MMPL family transporter [Thermodesulfobacteriota bacterium]